MYKTAVALLLMLSACVTQVLADADISSGYFGAQEPSACGASGHPCQEEADKYREPKFNGQPVVSEDDY